MSDISELTQIAKQQIGNNGSKYRKWYYNTSTDYYGVNWCAVFISWLFNQIGGINKYLIKTDGAGTFARYSDGKYGKWYKASQTKPKEGDVITFRWGGSYTDKYHSDHVGYVYKADNSYVYTIEGNTGNNNPDLSSVMYKSYSISSGVINGYFRPNYDEKGENYMEIQKGDKNEFVLAYKSLLIQARTLGIVSQKVDESNSFGDGTYKATIEVQQKYSLGVDGIAGVKTITALRNAINNELKEVKNSVINNTIEYLKKEIS